MDDHDDDRNVARIFYETGLLHNDLVPIVNGAGHADSTPRQEKAALASGESHQHATIHYYCGWADA